MPEKHKLGRYAKAWSRRDNEQSSEMVLLKLLDAAKPRQTKDVPAALEFIERDKRSFGSERGA